MANPTINPDHLFLYNRIEQEVKPLDLCDLHQTKIQDIVFRDNSLLEAIYSDPKVQEVANRLDRVAHKKVFYLIENDQLVIADRTNKTTLKAIPYDQLSQTTKDTCKKVYLTAQNTYNEHLTGENCLPSKHFAQPAASAHSHSDLFSSHETTHKRGQNLSAQLNALNFQNSDALVNKCRGSLSLSHSMNAQCFSQQNLLMANQSEQTNRIIAKNKETNSGDRQQKKGEIKEITNKLSQLQQTLNEKENECSTLQNRISQLRGEISSINASHEGEISGLKAIYEGDRNTKESLLTRARADLEDMKETNKLLADKKKDLENRLTGIQASLETSNKNLDSEKVQNADLTNQQKAFSQQIEELRNQLNQSKQDSKDLEKTLENIQNETANLKEDRDNSTKARTSKEHENFALKEKMNQLQVKIKDRIAHLKTTIAAYEDTNRRCLHEQEENLNKATIALQIAEQEVQNLRKQLDQVNNALSETQVTPKNLIENQQNSIPYHLNSHALGSSSTGSTIGDSVYNAIRSPQGQRNIENQKILINGMLHCGPFSDLNPLYQPSLIPPFHIRSVPWWPAAPRSISDEFSDIEKMAEKARQDAKESLKRVKENRPLNDSSFYTTFLNAGAQETDQFSQQPLSQ
ncbi:MAG TPA: hypothetical protein DCY54_06095 [Parachlamydiales bacterium]|nr:hypothetical protein [Parachlamydiales bacterium]